MYNGPPKKILLFRSWPPKNIFWLHPWPIHCSSKQIEKKKIQQEAQETCLSLDPPSFDMKEIFKMTFVYFHGHNGILQNE